MFLHIWLHLSSFFFRPPPLPGGYSDPYTLPLCSLGRMFPSSFSHPLSQASGRFKVDLPGHPTAPRQALFFALPGASHLTGFLTRPPLLDQRVPPSWIFFLNVGAGSFDELPGPLHLRPGFFLSPPLARYTFSNARMEFSLSEGSIFVRFTSWCPLISPSTPAQLFPTFFPFGLSAYVPLSSPLLEPRLSFSLLLARSA